MVAEAIARRLHDLISASSLAGFDEPRVYAPDDSLVVDWHLPNGVRVGLFIADEDTWELVAVWKGEAIKQVHVDSQEALVGLLRRYSILGMEGV